VGIYIDSICTDIRSHGDVRMKKRAMKKWIPEGDFCYTIVKIEHVKNQMPIMKCRYCRNRYRGQLVDDEMSDNLGGFIPVKRRRIMCRYLNSELFYEDSKECGEKCREEV